MSQFVQHDATEDRQHKRDPAHQQPHVVPLNRVNIDNPRDQDQKRPMHKNADPGNRAKFE